MQAYFLYQDRLSEQFLFETYLPVPRGNFEDPRNHARTYLLWAFSTSSNLPIHLVKEELRLKEED